MNDDCGFGGRARRVLHTGWSAPRTRRRCLHAALLGALLLLLIPLQAGLAAGGGQVSPTVSANNGFPVWYEDAAGIRVAPCLDGTDPNCVLPGVGEEPNFNPTHPTSFPANFPGEFFYWVADSDLVSTPGCNGTQPGRAFVRMALEGAFGGAAPVAGDQMVFGRIRVRVTSGLCPGVAYTITHPYGTQTFVPNAQGGGTVTEDVGCVPPACDFSLALGSPIFNGFLRWDPAVAPAAPAGYLGDAITGHQVIGSPTGNNFFRIARATTTVARTDLFTVAGKLDGPLTASTPSLTFADQPAGTTSASQTVTFRNVGLKPVAITTAAIGGANAAAFRKGADTCSGTTVPAGGTCAVAVSFAPAVAGTANAKLSVTHNGLNTPTEVTLSGLGIVAGQPNAKLDPTVLDFLTQKVASSSNAQRVTVTNDGGTVALQIANIAIGGTNAGDFALGANTCANPVAPGASCEIEVRFAPTVTGLRTASLDLTTNAPGSPQSATLRGIGVTGGAAVSADRDTNNGYPLWYQDNNGLRVGPCLDGTDPMCVLPGAGEEPNWDPAQPASLPSNFPSEFFYWIAESDLLATPGCGASPPGKLGIRVALEGAFLGEDPIPGEQILFGRVRIFATSGLCANTTYTFKHPYGQTVLTTNEQGAIPRARGTDDIGCFPVPPGTCDFAAALQSPVLGSFLRWDPSFAPAAPAGYLGDAITLHRITGSPVGQNIFQALDPAGNTVAETDMFTVSGKTAGPLLSKPTFVAFGGQDVGTTSAAKAATLTNVGPTPLTISGSTVTGAAFAKGADACTGVTLQQDQSCTIATAFHPTALGKVTGTLAVTHDGIRSPLAVRLEGTGIAAAAAPQLRITPASVAFGDHRVITRSASQRVTVENIGNAPLSLSAALAGPNAGEFQIMFNDCAGVFIEAGSSCAIDVQFGPTAAGARSASLVLTSNAPGSPNSVPLTGTGTGGLAAVSPDRDANNGYPTWYQDETPTRIVPCLDGADPQCVLPAPGEEPNFNRTLPTTLPTNFPSEFFYTVAQSEDVGTPGCQGTLPGKAHFRAAVEGAFLGATPTAGEQITFGRIRIIVTSGLCPNTEYTFTHPYGTETLTTNDAGAIPAIAGTEDVGCVPVPPATCNFAEALPSRVFGGFLRWDPAVAPAAPAGYLGDAGVLHKVSGSPIGQNFFRITHGIERIGETNLFTVSGKTAAVTPPAPAPAPAVGLAPASLTFADQTTGTTSATQTVTLTNTGNANLNITAIALGGLNPGDFNRTGTCAAPLTIAAGGTCTIVVSFAPTAVGARTANVTITDNATGSPHTVALSGNGVAPAAPGVSLTPASLAFGDQVVGTASAAQTVTLTNTGNAALSISGLAVAGANAGDFTRGGTCAAPGTVAAGASCTITATFGPTATGPRTASISITSNAAGSPHSIALTGNGTAPPPTALLGAEVIQPSVDFNNAGLAEAFRVTASTSGTLGTLRVFVDAGSTATSMIAGLYANSATNHPGTLLARGTLTGPTAGAWNNVQLANGVSVTAGTVYWIALLSPTGAGTLRFRDRCCGGGSPAETSSQTTLASLPATWTTGSSFTDGPVSAVGLSGIVAPDSTAPTVSVTSPAAGATVSATINVNATAADNVGVSGVQFLLDGAALGAEDTAAPYTVSWNTTTATNGAHQLTARARDAAGNTTTSAIVGVTVNNTVAPPPPPPPPPATGTFLLGDQTVEPSVDFNPAGMAEAFRAPASVAGTVTALRVFVDAGSTATSLVAGLYSDAGGHPGTLLAQGTLGTLTNGALNTVPVPATPVTAGTTYWIAILGPAGSGTLRFRDRCCGGGQPAETSSQTTLTSLPAAWSTGSVFSDGPATAFGIG
jgi:hypothetical protein